MTTGTLFRKALAAALFAGLASPWLAASAQTMREMPGMSDPDKPAVKAMMAGMAKMNKGMAKAPMTGNADADFVAMMIPHHEGAVDMARIELQYGKDPAMRRLAVDIVAAQDREIALMKAWEKARH